MSKKKTTPSKKKPTAKKKSTGKGILVRIVLILIVAALILYLGIKYFPQVQAIQDEIDEVKLELTEIIPETTATNLVLPETIAGHDEIAITWKSSDEKTLSKLGVVNAPSYEEENKTVTLTATISFSSDDVIANLFYDLLKVNRSDLSFTIVIKSREASSEEKIAFIKNGLFVPKTTNTDIGLLTEDPYFNSVEITWESSNTSIMTATGKKLSAGSVNLTATLTCEDKSEKVVFPLLVTNELSEVTAVEMTFDNIKTGTYSTAWESNGWLFTRAILADDLDASFDPESISEQKAQICRLKAENGKKSSLELIEFITNPSRISFDYEIFATDKRETYTKDTYLLVSIMKNDAWQLLFKSSPLGSAAYHFDYDLSGFTGDIRLKVEIETSYASIRVDLDNVVISRFINREDIKKWVKDYIPSSLSKTTILPLTTSYGGVITYNSNHQALSKNGVVTKESEATKVVLTAVITGFGDAISLPLEVTVKGTKSVTPVEIYFIDLGKYGQSDCGESIYIKYANIDVLVDAGDNIKASNRAIQEVIDLYSEDKIIEYLIATHPDADHIGGLPFVFEVYEVVNLIQFNGDHTTKLYQDYVNSYTAEGCSVCTILDSYHNVGSCTRIIELGPEVVIEFLNTQNYEMKEPNSRSIVFILEAFGIRTLLTGDADNGANSALESEYMNSVGNIDILKAVHHGTREGTTEAFLQAVDPEVVIITNGNYLGNKHGHPTYEAINRIYQYDNEITIYAVVGGDSEVCELTTSKSYRCELQDPMVDRNGTIKITIDNNGYQISSEYYGENPLELSSTHFWKTNPMKTAQYAK